MLVKCKCGKEVVMADKTKILSIICPNCKKKVHIKKPIKIVKKGVNHGISKKSKNTR